jgi:hypothetical protein
VILISSDAKSNQAGACSATCSIALLINKLT